MVAISQKGELGKGDVHALSVCCPHRAPAQATKADLQRADLAWAGGEGLGLSPIDLGPCPSSASRRDLAQIPLPTKTQFSQL